MRLPTNPENWTPHHADLAVAEAWRRFDEYERRIDFSWPQEKQDQCYYPYWRARQTAAEVFRYVWHREPPLP
jgi:hypothetical protein